MFIDFVLHQQFGGTEVTIITWTWRSVANPHPLGQTNTDVSY